MAFIHVRFDKTLVTLQSPKIAKNIFLDLTKKSKTKMKALEGITLDTDTIESLKSKNILVW